MSVDTNKFRGFYTGTMYERTSVNADIAELCDEIDRLREDNQRKEDALGGAFMELSELRERLRPRSIKDEPPPAHDFYLACDEGEDTWYRCKSPHPRKSNCWLPMPPAPPKLDAFEVFWGKLDLIAFCEDEGEPISKSTARKFWYAAIQSMKAKP